MTRFGMQPADFAELAELIRDVIVDDATVQPRVEQFRERFLEMQFCFNESEFEEQMARLHDLV
jgi:hypothetical protein